MHEYRHTLRELVNSLLYGLSQVGLSCSYDGRRYDRQEWRRVI